MKMLFLSAWLFMASPPYALSSNDSVLKADTVDELMDDMVGGCSADSFLTDFQLDFDSEDSAFKWCFQRVVWWNLSRTDWKRNFCTVERYSFGDQGYYWSSKFWHHFRSYNARYPGRIFPQFERDFAGRLWKGWSGRILFSFSQTCDGYDY
jgi:hypothetical protein